MRPHVVRCTDDESEGGESRSLSQLSGRIRCAGVVWCGGDSPVMSGGGARKLGRAAHSMLRGGGAEASCWVGQSKGGRHAMADEWLCRGCRGGAAAACPDMRLRGMQRHDGVQARNGASETNAEEAGAGALRSPACDQGHHGVCSRRSLRRARA
jgi:hypothetical protein